MSIAILSILGLCIGSFINALVYRLYKQSEKLPAMKKKRTDDEERETDYSIVRGRSMCPHCRHQLSAFDLLPVLSWVSLRSKCRYCRAPISWQYPLVELATAGLFVLSFIAWPRVIEGFVLFEFISWLLLLSVLITLAVYDLKYMLLPNKLVAVGGAIVAVYITGQVIFQEGHLNHLWGAILGLVAFGGLFYVLYQISDGRWIGGGDVKLGFVLGAWLGSMLLSFLAIFVASLIGSFIVMILAVFRRVTMKTRLPFGPLLIVATIIVTLYGEGMLRAYYNHMLAV